MINTSLANNLLNIVIPMAGKGSRFSNAGYSRPKPLIEIHSKPMIELVINNLRPATPYRFIFLCLQEHINRYGIDKHLQAIEPTCTVVPVESVTEGAACTVLLAEKHIDNAAPLMIANSDQWIDFNVDEYLAYMQQENLGGLIMTMKASDPKWSFARIDPKNLVTEVVEKQVISDEATTGIYNFAHGTDFVSAAKSMIRKNLRVNGEFYVAPVYNELVAQGMKIGIFNIGTIDDGMYGLGIPEDLERFLQMDISNRAAGNP